MLNEGVIQSLINHVSYERKKVARLGIWTSHLHVGGRQRFWKDLASGERAAVQVPTCEN